MAQSTAARRNHIGTISLLAAVAGSIGTRLAGQIPDFPGREWIHFVAAGFDAALVGALADWFAVTALFRHPLGIPIPHTAIIPTRRAKIIEGIVSMVQHEWLSPEVIAGRLSRFSPSELLTDWLRDPNHVDRLGGPLRDLLRAFAVVLDSREVTDFAERAVRRQFRDVPIGPESGRWLLRAVESDNTAAAFESAARSLAAFANRTETAAALQVWLARSAEQLHRDGKRLIPLLLRRRLIQEKIVEAACDYATVELVGASTDPEHPLRKAAFTAVRRFADRLANGDREVLDHIEKIRAALVESLDLRPLLERSLVSLRGTLEDEMQDAESSLSILIHREIRSQLLAFLDDPTRRSRIDLWVRQTADDLLRKHHDQIGLTVRENLEALDSDTLVQQIEDRVGGDLQFIRLNGALVGGIIGVLLAILHAMTGY